MTFYDPGYVLGFGCMTTALVCIGACLGAAGGRNGGGGSRDPSLYIDG